MRILFILDPLPSLKINKDSSYAMICAASTRGHQIHACQVADLMMLNGQVSASVQDLALTTSQHTHAWYTLGASRTVALSVFDAVLMRKDPPFDLEYLYATHLLEHATRQGARVWNAPRALRDHPEKLAIAEFSEFTVPTLVTRQAEKIKAFYTQHGDLILKPLDGMGGSKVFRVQPGDPNLNVIIETLTRNGAETIMAQRYIPAIQEGDKRILLIAGKPVPYALARLPAPGETRGNLAAGGSGRAQALSTRDLEIANALGPILWARGLLLVGLDVIGEYLTEINVTSPTCFQEITQQTGCHVAELFVDALESM